ncbi:RHS repeat-associated core domain-containing protein [Agrobacterium vitis]|nr:RHS repeat-associated core domain-containing protein [Allorhizobium ampelinum]
MLAIVSDHLGTPKEMFDAKGTLIWAADHHVWGAVRTTKTFGALAALPRHDRPPEELQCPWRFPGQYEDTETGLCYNRHRHYDPLTGQYASPDPIGLAGGDRPQGYVSNPNTLVDVLGLSSTSGNATLHWYDNRDPTNSTGHWAIETEFDGNKILTHQLGAPGYNTLIDDTIDMVPTKSSVVVLPDAKTAQAFQRSQIGKDLGEYNIKTRSCQTHLCEVLQSGGVDAPDNPIKFNRYLKDLGVYPPSNK